MIRKADVMACNSGMRGLPLLLLSVCLLVPIGAAWPEAPHSIADELRLQLPNLPDVPDAATLQRLQDLRNSSDASVQKGLGLLLMSSQFAAIRNSAFVQIDGRDTEWSAVPFGGPDARGDAEEEMDLIEFRALPDGEGNLLVMHRVLHAEQKKRESGFIVNIFEMGPLGLQFIYDFYDSTDRGYYNVIDRSNWQAVRHEWIPFSFARVGAAEARIPLREIMLREGLPSRPSVSVQGGVNGDMGDTFIVPLAGQNDALQLLVHLLAHNCYRADDSMAIAIALANSRIFSASDNQTRPLILADIEQQFRFYQEVIAWQEASGLSFRLSNAPVIAQIFWADRRRYSEFEAGTDLLTPRSYREFIDQPANLRFLLQKIQSECLAEGRPGLRTLAANLEGWYQTVAQYRSSMENLERFNQLGWLSDADLHLARDEQRRGLYEQDYFGKRRRWDGFGWLNYQVTLFRQTGLFRGDCGTATTIQMALYRAAGLPPLSLQFVGANAETTHNFPAYYGFVLDRWNVHQRADLAGSAIDLYYSKPWWHSLAFRGNFYRDDQGRYYSSYYQGERTTTARLRSFLERGIDESQLESLFLSNATMEPGLIFNQQSAPAQLLDRDGDGLLDEDERRLGTNPADVDSDRDGFSDRWEVEWGNPRDATIPPRAAYALDGLVTNQPGWIRTESPRGDSRAQRELYDVASLEGNIGDDRMRLAVSYHNDIRANHLHLHSFSIETEGAAYWVQWYRGNATLYLRAGEDFRPIGSGGLQEATLTGAEFEIPLRCFRGARQFRVTYHAPGWFDGREQIVADSSGPIELGTADSSATRALQRASPGPLPGNPLPSGNVIWLRGQ